MPVGNSRYFGTWKGGFPVKQGRPLAGDHFRTLLRAQCCSAAMAATRQPNGGSDPAAVAASAVAAATRAHATAQNRTPGGALGALSPEEAAALAAGFTEQEIIALRQRSRLRSDGPQGWRPVPVLPADAGSAARRAPQQPAVIPRHRPVPAATEPAHVSGGGGRRSGKKPGRRRRGKQAASRRKHSSHSGPVEVDSQASLSAPTPGWSGSDEQTSPPHGSGHWQQRARSQPPHSPQRQRDKSGVAADELRHRSADELATWRPDPVADWPPSHDLARAAGAQPCHYTVREGEDPAGRGEETAVGDSGRFELTRPLLPVGPALAGLRVAAVQVPAGGETAKHIGLVLGVPGLAAAEAGAPPLAPAVVVWVAAGGPAQLAGVCIGWVVRSLSPPPLAGTACRSKALAGRSTADTAQMLQGRAVSCRRRDTAGEGAGSAG